MITFSHGVTREELFLILLSSSHNLLFLKKKWWNRELKTPSAAREGDL